MLMEVQAGKTLLQTRENDAKDKYRPYIPRKWIDGLQGLKGQ